MKQSIRHLADSLCRVFFSARRPAHPALRPIVLQRPVAHMPPQDRYAVRFSGDRHNSSGLRG